MIPHWPFWLGALGLAGVAVLHWLGLGRLMAVSGSFSAFVNRARHREASPGDSMSEAEDELGPRSLASSADALTAAASLPAPRATMSNHAVFLLGLIGGGFLSAAIAGAFEITLGLRSQELAAISHTSAPSGAIPLLAVGGVLVGFGTRMASGCTSGHGLCGVSRLQVGSLAATMAFFGTGIVVSFLLGAIG